MAAVIPLVVIVGPTASGKTALALGIAEHFGGEIIAADSRTVYRELDIGTAKPTKQEQQKVPHHLIDVANPDERFTAADFQQQAKKAIEDIRMRRKLPVLVGGTGLYVDSLLFNYEFGDPADQNMRQRLTSMSTEQLQSMIEKQQLPLPENTQNKRHLVRVLEQGKINNAKYDRPIEPTIIVGIATEKANLDQRIRQRAQSMFADGVLQEASRVAGRYGWDTEAMSGNIYRLARKVNEGRLTKEEAIEKFIVLDRRLAKRQRTWFRRNSFIVWKELGGARTYLEDQLHRAGVTSVLR